MERVQTLVVGAGVVGLAVARALARSGREVVVAESAGAIGTGTSSRNSEVLHAGIYYPTNSLKARHCVAGHRELLRYCADRDVRHNVCGKLIVATTEAQLAALEAIRTHAAANGVTLRSVCAAEARDLEPEVSCIGALHSPRTGVVDSHSLMEALAMDAQDAGALVAFQTRVLPGGELRASGALVEARGSEGHFQLHCDEVVNCAGLGAPRVASCLGVREVPRGHFCKGSYFALQPGCGGPRRPFRGLVYPVPEPNTAGLGVHATVDLGGDVRFGPDTEWLPALLPSGRAVDEVAHDAASQTELYAVDSGRASGFYEEVRKYWPGLPDDALVADYSGVRPKLSGLGQKSADFRIQEHVPGVVSLFGIESPGLTSSLSLADAVLRLLNFH